MSIFGESSDELIERCEAANIEYEEEEESEEYMAWLAVSLQAGRKKRDIFFSDEEDIDEFLEIDFLEEQERIQRDVFERVNTFLNGLQIESWQKK